MIRVLVSARDHGNPKHHLTTPAQLGGYPATLAALHWRGLMTMGDDEHITPAGLQRLRELGR